MISLRPGLSHYTRQEFDSPPGFKMEPGDAYFPIARVENISVRVIHEPVIDVYFMVRVPQSDVENARDIVSRQYDEIDRSMTLKKALYEVVELTQGERAKRIAAEEDAERLRMELRQAQRATQCMYEYAYMYKQALHRAMRLLRLTRDRVEALCVS